MRWDWGEKEPPRCPRPTSLSHSAHKAQPPCPDPCPLPGSDWGELSHGKAALGHTKHPSIPRLCRGPALGSQVCCEPTGPRASVEGRSPALAWVMLLACCETGRELSSRPQFPRICGKDAGTAPGTLNCVPAAGGRTGTLGKSPR